MDDFSAVVSHEHNASRGWGDSLVRDGDVDWATHVGSDLISDEASYLVHGRTDSTCCC